LKKQSILKNPYSHQLSKVDMNMDRTNKITSNDSK